MRLLKWTIQVYTTLESITVSPFTGPFISIKKDDPPWNTFFLLLLEKRRYFLRELQRGRCKKKDNYSSSSFLRNVYFSWTTSIIEWGQFLTVFFSQKTTYKYVYILYHGFWWIWPHYSVWPVSNGLTLPCEHIR